MCSVLPPAASQPWPSPLSSCTHQSQDQILLLLWAPPPTASSHLESERSLQLLQLPLHPAPPHLWPPAPATLAPKEADWPQGFCTRPVLCLECSSLRWHKTISRNFFKPVLSSLQAPESALISPHISCWIFLLAPVTVDLTFTALVCVFCVVHRLREGGVEFISLFPPARQCSHQHTVGAQSTCVGGTLLVVLTVCVQFLPGL